MDGTGNPKLRIHIYQRRTSERARDAPITRPPIQSPGVGLAPTGSLMRRLPRSGGDRRRVVFGAVVAIIGSDLRPVVMTA
jgi:hypothetical protein